MDALPLLVFKKLRRDYYSNDIYTYSDMQIRSVIAINFTQQSSPPYLCTPMKKSLPHDDIVPFKDSDQTKKRQVARMFDQIAFRYDFLNRFLSGGIDVYWRRRAIRELQPLHPKKILDVATGTADMAILSAKMLNPETIVGIDISEGMLQLGRKKDSQLVVK